jgi:demethylphylloquinol methyltransferase
MSCPIYPRTLVQFDCPGVFNLPLSISAIGTAPLLALVDSEDERSGSCSKLSTANPLNCFTGTLAVIERFTPMQKISKYDLGRNYDRTAWFYEKSAKFYSTNQIRRSKKYQLKYLSPGTRVLYLGAGAGEDAVMAAEAGAEVTCLDISQRMLERVGQRLASKQLTANLICKDAFDYVPVEPFDVVAANYFLNVFRREPMCQMLRHSASFVRPNGYYLIADVALPQGNPAARLFNLGYLKFAMASFWLLGLVPWHENYDYPAFFSQADLELEHVEYFRFAKRGPVLFQSIVAKRSPEPVESTPTDLIRKRNRDKESDSLSSRSEAAFVR